MVDTIADYRMMYLSYESSRIEIERRVYAEIVVGRMIYQYDIENGRPAQAESDRLYLLNRWSALRAESDGLAGDMRVIAGCIWAARRAGLSVITKDTPDYVDGSNSLWTPDTEPGGYADDDRGLTDPPPWYDGARAFWADWTDDDGDGISRAGMVWTARDYADYWANLVAGQLRRYQAAAGPVIDPRSPVPYRLRLGGGAAAYVYFRRCLPRYGLRRAALYSLGRRRVLDYDDGILVIGVAGAGLFTVDDTGVVESEGGEVVDGGGAFDTIIGWAYQYQ